MTKNKMKIRLTKKSDLIYLDKIRDKKLHKLHLKRIKTQERKEAEYLIAFYNKKPIGHVFINYKSKRRWHKSPIIEDLFIKDEEREKGYAKKIMLYAENLVKEKGFKTIELDVETNEKWIRSFYESLGYKKISGPHKLNYVLEDEGDKEITETVYHLKKSL